MADKKILCLFSKEERIKLRVPQELDTTFTGFQWIDNERNNYD